MIEKVRQHFGDLLSATSIVFGFALAALLFYIQAAAAWAKDPDVDRVANKSVDWHVWTIVCMLFLIGYMLGLWSFGVYRQPLEPRFHPVCFPRLSTALLPANPRSHTDRLVVLSHRERLGKQE